MQMTLRTKIIMRGMITPITLTENAYISNVFVSPNDVRVQKPFVSVGKFDALTTFIPKYAGNTKMIGKMEHNKRFS